jgi:arylsulfatase
MRTGETDARGKRSAKSNRDRARQVGKQIGEGDIEATLAIIFSADDGRDSGAPVSPDYGPLGNAFNGEIKGIQLSIADNPNNADHLVKPEDVIRAALGRQ